jgi:MFS family permease
LTTPTQNSPSLRGNFWKVYAYRFLSDFWLIAPILVPYYQANGLSATQVFVVQAIYAASLMTLEIPSGYLADVIGRKNTLVLGSVMLPIGLLVYALSNTFQGFVAAEIILGAAGAMRSGADSALMYDTLIQLDREAEYNRFEGRGEFFHQAAHALSSVAGGLLALVSLKFVFQVNVASGLALVPLAFALVEPERKKLDGKSPLLDILRITKRCLTDPRIRSLMMYSALMTGSIVTGVWSYYMYYAELGLSVALFGIIFAAFGLCAAMGAARSHRIEEWLGARASFRALLLLSPIFVSLALVKSVYMIPLILLNAFVGGFAIPLFRNQINKLIESDIRATALSVGAMMGSLAMILMSPTFGKLVDTFSLSTAHLTLGAFHLTFGLLCLFLLRKHEVI